MPTQQPYRLISATAGALPTRQQHARAVEVAKAVEGAQRVQNGMTVKK